MSASAQVDTYVETECTTPTFTYFASQLVKAAASYLVN